MKRKQKQEDENIQAYFANKEQLDEIRSNATLLKWEVLSKAYKQGKEIWGNDFSVKKLSNDMGLPYTTTKRCLALDKATPKSWELLRAKKISAFQLAMVCMTKNNQFQDEIVAEVIKNKLSTYQIKKFKPKNIKDIAKWKHKQAITKGYSRKEASFTNFNKWIDRGFVFLIMPFSSIGNNKKKELITKLKKLHNKLGAYIEKNG